jgi:hypothetical protein
MRFPVIPGRPFAESLAGIPPSFAAFLRHGFTVLSTVGPQHYSLLVEQAVEAIDCPTLRGEEKIATEIGVKEDDLTPLVAAVTMVCVTLSSGEETPESLVNAAIGAKIVSDAQKDVLLEFAKIVAQARSRMKEAMLRSNIASRVLPALTEFSTAVDVRLSFKREEIVNSVPVVVAHVDTDTAEQELWFQMSKSQLKFLIENLQDTLRRLELAEAWSEQRLPLPTKRR